VTQQAHEKHAAPRALTRRHVTILSVAAALAACAVTPPAAVLSADDRIAIQQITAYLNNLHSFTARFAQEGPDGISQGQVWLQRPGQLCVAYERPRPKLMIANHGRLLLADQTTGATTSLPVSRTPLDIMLAPTIELTNSITITRIQRLPDAIQLSLVKTASPGQGTLTLRFSANPLALAGVTILDRNGQTTAFDLADLRPGVPIDPAHFVYHPPAATAP
jgi:outer membrane lipoprotein-sorting protein